MTSAAWSSCFWMQASQRCCFPPTLSPYFDIAFWNDSRLGFCFLQRTHVHIPFCFLPRVHSLQACSGEPSTISHAPGSNSWRNFSLLQRPHRLRSQSAHRASPSPSVHCVLWHWLFVFAFLHFARRLGAQSLHLRTPSAFRHLRAQTWRRSLADNKCCTHDCQSIPNRFAPSKLDPTACLRIVPPISQRSTGRTSGAVSSSCKQNN